MSRAQYFTILVLSAVQAIYALFWPILILIEFVPALGLSNAVFFSNSIQAAPFFMIANTFVYGALYVYTFARVLQRDLGVIQLYSIGLTLHFVNWVFTLWFGEYKGEIGAVFVLNGLILLTAMLMARVHTQRG